MAHVTDKVRGHVELLLTHSFYQWQRLPRVRDEIDSWDLIDQIVFIEEWPLEEQHLRMIEAYAAKGVLTVEQIARLDELKRIVEQNRPIIRELQRT